MSVEQGALERKLIELRKAQDAEKARQTRIVKAQEAAIASVLMGALRDLEVLKKNPGRFADEVNIVAQRHAGRVLRLASGQEKL